MALVLRRKTIQIILNSSGHPTCGSVSGVIFYLNLKLYETTVL